ncbi:MAG TPA: hypothetical protein VFN31_02885 [Candidatus Saccharimonadales bacterium]|nr:hypothetical protein [Candidatus Saccharimonadales bacterium]
MSTHVQQIKQVGNDGMVTERTARVDDNGADRVVTERRHASLASRIIWYVAGVLLVLLAFRFILALLGANATNQFANFIYSTSHPFVAPFFGLFGYNLHYGVSRFETFTLVAMLVYAVVAWGLARLFTIRRDAEIDSQV